MFDDEVEIDESYFGGQRKGKRGRGAAGKVAVFGLLYSVFWSEMVKFTLLPYRILKQQLCCLLFVNKLNLTALFIRIITTVMMCWTWVNLVTFASITAHILLNDKTILTELRTFGSKQNVIYVSLTVFLKSILSCIWRSVNGVLTTVSRISREGFVLVI